MIQIYEGTAIDFENNGIAVLHPESCTITEEAGGMYELSMVHPIDEHGLWGFIQPGHLIKAPVPVATTEQIVSGDSVDVYRVTANTTELRAKPTAPSRITYQTYVPPEISGVYYSKGDKVTFVNPRYPTHNYQCILTPIGDAALYLPPNLPECWKQIADYSSGAAILQTLNKDAEVYLLEKYSDSWLRVVTMEGIEGYVSASTMVYNRTIKVEPVEPRTVAEQLFRVYSVDVNTKNHRVNVSARHVSYDWSGILLGDCVIAKQPPSTALALMKNSLLQSEDFTLATNLTEEVDGSYTGTHTHNNFINALMDPDTGFLNSYRARLFRDNWDMFIYRNTERNRGFRLKYGKNLIGVTWKRSTDKLINRVMPIAKKADGTNLLIDSIFVDSPLIDTYPVIKMEQVQINEQVGKDDGTGENWTEATLKEYMINEAQKRFDVDNADKVQTQIKVEFLLLGDTEEYAQYKGLQKLYLYDTVFVENPTIALAQTLQVSKVTWDAIKQRYTSITLGDVFNSISRSIAGYQIHNGTIQFNKLSADAVAKLRG